MKTKKLLALLTFLFLGLVCKTSFGQDKDAKAMLKESTPEQRAKMQTGMMKAKLQLDSLTTTKVQAINFKYAQKLDPVLKSDGRRLKMMRDVVSIQKEKDAELKSTLTKDQYSAYEQMKDDMREKLKEYKQQN